MVHGDSLRLRVPWFSDSNVTLWPIAIPRTMENRDEPVTNTFRRFVVYDGPANYMRGTADVAMEKDSVTQYPSLPGQRNLDIAFCKLHG